VATATDGRLRFALVIASGVIVTVLVTIGVAHAYYGNSRIVPVGMVHAPIEWIPQISVETVDPQAALAQSATPRSTRAQKKIYIPALPDLNGVSPKTLGFKWPTHGYHGVTFPFGPHDGNQFHHGTDIACALGQPLYASKAGRIVFAGDAGSAYGNAVAIEHGNTYMTVYGHLSVLSVEPGELVASQQKIGLCGQTGNATGPHVHFELRYRNYVWDPMLFLP
jgi:murein DD-endopeptidase MepM/ murein hydrolase activator NlpD